jgi:hypothetical protein
VGRLIVVHINYVSDLKQMHPDVAPLSRMTSAGAAVCKPSRNDACYATL